MPVDFYGPLLKVERAKHHVRDLETIFGRYVSDNVKRLAPERKHRLLKRGQVARPATFPKHTPTVLGDALHNLRASLDHAYCILIEHNGGTADDYARFPFYQKRSELEGSINGQKKAGKSPSEAICAAIVDEMQPYDGGKLGLYGLHRLDITDKHLVLIPTEPRMHIGRLEFLDERGIPRAAMHNLTLAMSDSSARRGAEFIGAGPGGAVLHDDPKTAFDICFEKGQPFEGESIIKVVGSLSEAVAGSLELLKAKAG